MLGFKKFNDWLAEKEVQVEIGKKVVGYIEDTDTDAINQITRIANSASSKESIVNFLLSIGYPSEQAELLFDKLSKGSDMKKVSEYFNNRTFSIENYLGTVIDSYSINSLIGMGRQSSLEFFNFSWRTTPSMGPGEAYLSTIFKGGKRPGNKEKGDVIVDDKEVEVKGPGARLVGQHGYSDAKLMRKAFDQTVQNIAKSLGVENYVVEDDGNDKFWNITSTDARGIEVNLRKISNLVGGFKPKDLQLISSNLVNAYNTYLTRLDTRANADLFTKSIQANGSLNVKDFNRSLLEFYFNYYYENEKFDYFCMTNTKGMFLIIKPSEFISYFDKGIIKVDNTPNFSDRAGSQGGSFAIALR